MRHWQCVFFFSCCKNSYLNFIMIELSEMFIISRVSTQNAFHTMIIERERVSHWDDMMWYPHVREIFTRKIGLHKSTVACKLKAKRRMLCVLLLLNKYFSLSSSSLCVWGLMLEWERERRRERVRWSPVENERVNFNDDFLMMIVLTWFCLHFYSLKWLFFAGKLILLLKKIVLFFKLKFIFNDYKN